MVDKNTANQNLLPELRFPEFEGTWTEKSFGSLFKQRQERGGEELPLLSLTAEYGIIPQSASGRKDNSNSDKSRYLKVVEGDIAYNTMRMWEGRSALSNREGLVSPAYTICAPKPETDSTFFSYYVKTSRLIELFYRNSQGLTKDTYSLKFPSFAKIKTLVPPTPAEQQKIADCLGSLDDLIAAHSRKLAALQDHKKGLLQQLFPAEGETTPKLRFPEFENSSAWKPRRLRECVKLISGLHLVPEAYGPEGSLPYFTGPSDFTDSTECVTKWTDRTGSTGHSGDTLITVKGSGCGSILSLHLEEVALGRQLMAIRPVDIHGDFLFHFLATKRRFYEDLSLGNLIPGLSRDDILDTKFRLPEPNEQEKIAETLNYLDRLANSEGAALISLKEHKKGLMQQLFPNPDL